MDAYDEQAWFEAGGDGRRYLELLWERGLLSSPPRHLLKGDDAGLPLTVSLVA